MVEARHYKANKVDEERLDEARAQPPRAPVKRRDRLRRFRAAHAPDVRWIPFIDAGRAIDAQDRGGPGSGRKDYSAGLPKVSLPADSVVYSLSGDFRLAELEGRLESTRSPERTGEEGSAEDPDWDGPARLWDIARLEGRQDQKRSDARPRVAGQLVGVDPTTLPSEQFGRLGALLVFSPDARAMLTYAKRRRVDRFDDREAAYKTQQTVRAISGRAVTGSVASAAKWASAHTHRKTARWGERTLRGLHRLVGYGQRPLPALATWLAVVTLGAGLAAWLPSESPAGFWALWLQFVLLPAALLRLPDEGGPPLIGDSWSLHTLAFAVVGLALVYLALALKNYLATPSSDGPPGPLVSRDG